jgi:hypothetical protein
MVVLHTLAEFPRQKSLRLNGPAVGLEAMTSRKFCPYENRTVVVKTLADYLTD